MAISTLQQALAGVNSQVSESVQKAKEDLKELMDKNNSSGVKGLADMDARLRKLNKRLGEMEDAIRKLEKLGKSDQDERDKNLGDVASWRQDTAEQFRDVRDKLRPIPDEISELQRQLAALKVDLEAKEEAERRKAAERSPTPPVQEPEPESEPERPAEELEDTEDLRNKVNKLEEDVQHTSSQVAKLENTVETLRTVLTQKIQSEAQTRGDTIAELKEQLERIKSTE